MDLKQLGRPIMETGRVERPAAGVRKPLSLLKVELCLLTVVDVEVYPNPIKESSIARSQWLGPTEEPAIPSFSVPNSKSHLTGATLA
jgi:hypothetical protein